MRVYAMAESFQKTYTAEMIIDEIRNELLEKCESYFGCGRERIAMDKAKTLDLVSFLDFSVAGSRKQVLGEVLTRQALTHLVLDESDSCETSFRAFSFEKTHHNRGK